MDLIFIKSSTTLLNKKRAKCTMISGILGIWFSVLVAAGYIYFNIIQLPPVACSGMNPCGDEEIKIYLAGLIICGVCSAITTSIISDFMLLGKIRPLIALAYGFVGLFVWPLIALFVALILLFFGALLTSIPFIQEYSYYLSLFAGLTLSGIGIGLTIGQITVSNNPELLRHYD